MPLDEHKLELLRAWWENSPNVDGPTVLLRGIDPHAVLGGKRVLRQVEALLRHERFLAHRAYDLVMERERWREWWDLTYERPADKEVQDALAVFVARRQGESMEGYVQRLSAIAERLRSRVVR